MQILKMIYYYYYYFYSILVYSVEYNGNLQFSHIRVTQINVYWRLSDSCRWDFVRSVTHPQRVIVAHQPCEPSGWFYFFLLSSSGCPQAHHLSCGSPWREKHTRGRTSLCPHHWPLGQAVPQLQIEDIHRYAIMRNATCYSRTTVYMLDHSIRDIAAFRQFV